jgi:hypothetical protein
MTTTRQTNHFRRLLLPCLSLLALCGLTSSARASDPVGVYAVVEKVVAEPADGTPQRVQVWGVFALNSGPRDEPYSAPAYGYLYYKADEKPDAARREWEDLKSVAGTGQVVAFASRWKEKGRVRKATDKPDAPDAYPVAMGVTKVRGGDWGPVRALLEVPVPVTPAPAAEVEAGKVTLAARAGKPRDATPAAKYVFEITAPGGVKETSDPVEAGADGKTTWSPKMKSKPGETYTWSVRKAGAPNDGAATSTFKAKGAAASAK